MSKVIKWQYSEFYNLRREKLVNLLFSEIIFLKSHFKKQINTEKRGCIEIALDKLEYLLNSLKKIDSELTESNFDKVVLIIYQIFQDIIKQLES
ncbi:MAG: hypothetical protein KGD67_06910 [Candidatus Lokiarchaeota archaeon]|nr:hypothetical protein [Candidatus Lokiarchaeota archaeon]